MLFVLWRLQYLHVLSNVIGSSWREVGRGCVLYTRVLGLVDLPACNHFQERIRLPTGPDSAEGYSHVS